MQELERIKSQTDDKEIQDDIDFLIRRVEELPKRIEEKKLIKKRARGNYKKGNL